MNHQQVFESVVKILSPFAKAPEALARCDSSTSILGDLKINSARMVDVMLELEELFSIEIRDEEVDKIRSVGDAVDLVLAKIAALEPSAETAATS
jgi:acyl carrier protein